MTATKEMTIQERNAETVRSWIQEASGGFLTGTYQDGELYSNFLVRRADGEALDGSWIFPAGSFPPAGQHSPYEVAFAVFLPTYRVLDRRYRKAMAEVRDKVRTTLIRYVSPEQIPSSAIEALRIFELRNNVR